MLGAGTKTTRLWLVRADKLTAWLVPVLKEPGIMQFQALVTLMAGFFQVLGAADDFARSADDDLVKGYGGGAVAVRGLDDSRKAAAAGDFHADDGYAF